MTDVTFSWEFPHWTITKRLNKLSDIVTAVNWRLTATDGEDNVTVFGEAKLPEPVEAKTFTPKEEITEQQLIEWIKPLIGYDGYVSNLTQRLADMKGPTSYAEPVKFSQKI